MYSKQEFPRGLVFGRMTDEDFLRFKFYPLKCLIWTSGIVIVVVSFIYKVIVR